MDTIIWVGPGAKPPQANCEAMSERAGRRNALIYHYYIEYNYALPFFYITVYQRPFKNE
jgi:hypothetical protein